MAIKANASFCSAQGVIAKSDNHKKRLCIDYSQTVNKFTALDVYLLPTMRNVMNDVAQYE